MQSNLKFQSLPITDDNSKIEVLLNEDEQVTLRLSTWTEGLGWCCQKTLSFDAVMLDDLQRALTIAKRRLNQNKPEDNQEIKSAKIIRLPFAA